MQIGPVDEIGGYHAQRAAVHDAHGDRAHHVDLTAHGITLRVQTRERGAGGNAVPVLQGFPAARSDRVAVVFLGQLDEHSLKACLIDNGVRRFIRDQIGPAADLLGNTLHLRIFGSQRVHSLICRRQIDGDENLAEVAHQPFFAEKFGFKAGRARADLQDAHTDKAGNGVAGARKGLDLAGEDLVFGVAGDDVLKFEAAALERGTGHKLAAPGIVGAIALRGERTAAGGKMQHGHILADLGQHGTDGRFKAKIHIADNETLHVFFVKQVGSLHALLHGADAAVLRQLLRGSHDLQTGNLCKRFQTARAHFPSELARISASIPRFPRGGNKSNLYFLHNGSPSSKYEAFHFLF